MPPGGGVEQSEEEGKGLLAGCDRKPRQPNSLNDSLLGLSFRQAGSVFRSQVDHVTERRDRLGFDWLDAASPQL